MRQKEMKRREKMRPEDRERQGEKKKRQDEA